MGNEVTSASVAENPGGSFRTVAGLAAQAVNEEQESALIGVERPEQPPRVAVGTVAANGGGRR